MPTNESTKERATRGRRRRGDSVRSTASGRTKGVPERRPERPVGKKKTTDEGGLRSSQARGAKAVGISTRETRDELIAKIHKTIRTVTGVETDEMARQLVTQLDNLQPWKTSKGAADRHVAAVSLLAEMKPTSATEAMLVVQMIGVHQLATMSLARANAEGQSFEALKEHTLLATRLMRIFNDQIALRAKLQGMVHQQKVTVEHVDVHSGGQAIVGAVSSSKSGPGQKGGD